MVKQAFDAYLRLEGLNDTAKWLNRNNFTPSRIQVAGGKARVGQFHVGVLCYLLKNKAYKGVKTYKNGDKVKEVKAVWDGIIEPEKFDMVQVILKKNYRRKKPASAKRWPYTLSGLTYCLKCNASMAGKSAHGAKRKHGYYEHGWASRRACSLVKNTLKCDPHRVPSDKLEALIDENIIGLLSSKDFAESIINDAHNASNSDSCHKELGRPRLAGGLSDVSAPKGRQVSCH